MPRKPYPVKRARAVLEDWLALRIPKSPTDAPISVAAAVEYLATKGDALKAHRGTLAEYGLTKLIKAAKAEQATRVGGHLHDGSALIVKEQADEIARLSRTNSELLGVIASMTHNAQMLGISEDELRRPLPVKNRPSRVVRSSVPRSRR